MTVPLRIGHANGHNEHSLVAWAKDTNGLQGWDSAGLAEVERLIRPLRALGHLVVTSARFDRAQDAPVLVNARHKMISGNATTVSRALGKRGSELNRVAPARVLTEARYTHPLATDLGCRGVAHLNLHPVAGPRQLNGRNPLAPLVRQYRKAWAAARRAARQAHTDGYLVVLTSDAQMTAASRRPWAPGRQARRMSLHAWSRGIDWVMYDRRLIQHGAPHIRPLFDHPGVVLTLTARKAHR